MTSQTGRLTSHNGGTTGKMPTLEDARTTGKMPTLEAGTGTEQCELSEQAPQVGSGCLDNEQSVPASVLASPFIDEKSNQEPEIVIGSSVILLPAPPQPDLEKSCQTAEGSCLQRSSLEQVPVHLSNDKSENQCQSISQNVPNVAREISDAVTGIFAEGQTLSVSAQVNTGSVNELKDPAFVDVKSIGSNGLGGNSNSTTHVKLRGKGKKNSKLLKKKYMLRSIGSSERALRSRTQEKPKPPESNINLVDANNDEAKRKKSRVKKKRGEEGVIDEFTRIRARLRYLLKRVSYEQSLIDAYSGEGWKGYSMEKLKPEKELQRAKSEIHRRKLKIRDLFRNLDSLCAEGRIPESLFDSEGELDSEDIFCAICSTKDLSLDNDIILCDGACERGFHQHCLNPPLLTENIPPGDEGWLCPGCDCKDDCIDIVNDSLGTNLSLEDSWERVFPEAAAVGNNVDNQGLPSDGSDDDDYHPNVTEDVEAEGGESSSDESEYASASEKLEDSIHEDQYMGLPSEDSEDDDYDPDAKDLDTRVAEECSSSDFTSDSEDLAAAIKENMLSGQDEDIKSASYDDVKTMKGSSRQKCKNGKKPSEYASASEKLENSSHGDQYMGLPSEDSEDDDYDPDAQDLDTRVAEESSSSDFTSDSEDLSAAIKDNMISGQDEDIKSASYDDVKALKVSSRQKCKVGKKLSMADELSSLYPGQESCTPVSGKRNVERLDYKKLYDETYQNDTSDDEDWTDTATPSRKKNPNGKVTPTSPNGKASNDSKHTPRSQYKVVNTNISPTKPLEGSGKSGSKDKKTGSSTYKRLGEAAVQRLYEHFKENQYPTRTTKESLAEEVGLTYQQVNKWFDNTRWSFRHSSHKESNTDKNASEQATDSKAENEEAPGSEQKDCTLLPEEGSGEKPKTPSSRKRKIMSKPETSEALQDVDTRASPIANEMQTSHKMKTRRRK